MNKDTNIEIEWIKNAKEENREFRAMIVGWQNVSYTVNTFVQKFNEEYFSEKKKNPHSVMNEIAAKKMVIAALFEAFNCVEKWFGNLRKNKLVSKELIEQKRKINKTIHQIEKYSHIRNDVGFHFNDPTKSPSELIALYEEIDSVDLEKLNSILKGIMIFGENIKKYINSNYSG